MKKIIVSGIAFLIFLSLLLTPLIYRAVGRGRSFLPRITPSLVRVNYFDEQGVRKENQLNVDESSNAILLFTQINDKKRICRAEDGTERLKSRSEYIRRLKSCRGAVQFYFNAPLIYEHDQVCACGNVKNEKYEYNHIDVMQGKNELYVYFMLDDTEIDYYQLLGSYLPSFEEILSAYNPEALSE